MRTWLADTVTSINSYSGLCISSTHQTPSLVRNGPVWILFTDPCFENVCFSFLFPGSSRAKYSLYAPRFGLPGHFETAGDLCVGKICLRQDPCLKILGAGSTARLIMENGEERHILQCDCLMKSYARSPKLPPLTTKCCNCR